MTHSSHALGKVRRLRQMTRSAADAAPEGVTHHLEVQSDQRSSNPWLWGAVGSIGLALLLKATGRMPGGRVVRWIAPLVVAGLYRELAKRPGAGRART